MDTDERPGMLLARIVIEKRATDDGIEMHVEGTDGSDDDLPLIDALGMLAYAQHHAWDSVPYNDEDEDED